MTGSEAANSQIEEQQILGPDGIHLRVSPKEHVNEIAKCYQPLSAFHLNPIIFLVDAKKKKTTL